MNLENIKCFISLSECLNFTKAAEKEHITQTAMSRKISSLEEELSIPLFYRDNRQVKLTEGGKEFYYQSLKLLEFYAKTVSTVQNIHHGFMKELKIGVGIYEHTLLSPFLKYYVSEQIPVKISCMQFGYHTLIDQFEQNHLDIILTSDQFFDKLPKEQLDIYPIYEKKWVLCVHKENPLSQLSSIPAERLQGQTLITMNEGSTTQIIDLYRHAFTVKDIVYVNSYETKVVMIDSNLGVGLFPSFVTTKQYEDLRPIPFAFPFKPRNFYILCRKNHPNHFVHDFFQKYIYFIQNENPAIQKIK